MAVDWVVKEVLSKFWIKGNTLFQTMYFFLLFTFLIVTEAESGQGSGITFEVPVCNAIRDGEDLSWEGILLDLTDNLEEMTGFWNKEYGKLNKNATEFVNTLNRAVFSKVFSCMPKYLSAIPDNVCECPYEDDDLHDGPKQEAPQNNESDDKDLSNWFEKIKEMLKKTKLKIEANIEEWALKDSFLFLCTTPGLISVTIQTARCCIRRRLKMINH